MAPMSVPKVMERVTIHLLVFCRAGRTNLTGAEGEAAVIDGQGSIRWLERWLRRADSVHVILRAERA
jgi:hypothetical protein